MGKMEKYEQLCSLYKGLLSEKFFKIELVNTQHIIGYTDMPNTLIGRIPIYEQQYVVKEWKLMTELLPFIMSSRVYATYNEAQEEADKLNRKLQNYTLRQEEICLPEEINEELE